MAGVNRDAKSDRRAKGKGKRTQNDNHVSKQEQGMQEIINEQAVAAQDFDLSWFHPTEAQKDIIISMCTNPLTTVQGSSGTGKSTTVIYQALQDLKRGLYRNGIVFVKTPSEAGDDQIGYLSGDANQKLAAHFESMRSIFYTFMSKEKLLLEEKRGRVRFTIPNFLQGETLDNSIIILEEAQNFSDNTVKLLLERTGENSTVVMLGDGKQRYAAKRRNDGFTHFIEMTTEENEEGKRESTEPLMGYIHLSAKDNMRSALSKRIVELYEEEV